MGWLKDPCVEKVRVDNADPLKLFTAVRRATHEAGIPECRFISRRCIKWPKEWGDHPWSAVARGVDLADFTRRSDEEIARSIPELIELDRRQHDARPFRSDTCPELAGTGAAACDKCNHTFEIPRIHYEDDYYYMPVEWGAPATTTPYYRHFPFVYLWVMMAQDKNGRDHPGPGSDPPERWNDSSLIIEIEDYVAGSGSITLAVNRYNWNRRRWPGGFIVLDSLREYGALCSNFASFLDHGAAAANTGAGHEGATATIQQEPPAKRRHVDIVAYPAAASEDRQPSALLGKTPKCRVLLAYPCNSGDYGPETAVVNSDGSISMDDFSPSIDCDDDQFFERLFDFICSGPDSKEEMYMYDQINSVGCIKYWSMRKYAASINYPLDYLRLLYPNDFANLMMRRGEIRGAIRTIERFVWVTLYNGYCHCCYRRFRRQRVLREEKDSQDY